MPASIRERRVLIVGGGYAGTRLARLLDAKADVVLIERRDAFVHNVAAIRAVADLSWLEKVVVPYDRLLARGEVIRGEVTTVRPDGATLRDGRHFDADFVVLAPGSSYASPFKPRDGEDHSTYQQRVREAHARLANAGSVAIVGAGPVGIELAGEISTSFPDKSVTLIADEDRLLPGYRPALSNKLLHDLRALGVHVLLGRRALNLPVTQEPYGPASITFDGAPAVEADLVFPVLGASPNTAFLDHSTGVTLERGRIVVDDRLQLPGLPGVFALGDAALTGDTLTIGGVQRQAPYLSKLLFRLMAGDALDDVRPYTSSPKPVIVVPVGPEHGASQSPMSLVVGAWATKHIKGRKLFVETVRKGLGQ